MKKILHNKTRLTDLDFFCGKMEEEAAEYNEVERGKWEEDVRARRVIHPGYGEAGLGQRKEGTLATKIVRERFLTLF